MLTSVVVTSRHPHRTFQHPANSLLSSPKSRRITSFAGPHPVFLSAVGARYIVPSLHPFAIFRFMNGGHIFNESDFRHSFQPISFTFRLLRTLLHPRKIQVFSFQANPNSFAKTPGVEYPP